MGKIISIANQKGGVGKTTTAINLAAAIGNNNKRVLVIDADPQGNATTGFGIEKNNCENTIYELLLGECSISDCIVKDVYKNLSVIPSNVNLAGIEVQKLNDMNREFLLKNELDWVKKDYDYIFIDCPPSLSMLTVNAMVASNSVLVPLQCEFYALEGLSQLIYTVNLVRKRLNKDLVLEGNKRQMYDSRTNLSHQVVDNVKESLKEYDYNIYETMIPNNVRLAEAPSHGQPICYYDPRSAGSESYMSLAREVIKNNEK